MTWVVALITALVGIVCVGLVVFGLPGAWMLLGAAAVAELVDGWWLGAPGVTFGWWVIGGGVAVAAFGEVVEVASGVVGTKTGGGSRRGMGGAFFGGLLGATAGTFVVPFVGTLIGALLGTFVGAYAGEVSDLRRRALADQESFPQTEAVALRQAPFQAAFRPAVFATVARGVGTIVKTGIAGVIAIALVVAALV